MSEKQRIFNELYSVITDRKENPKEGSYTNYLFDKGIDKILKKVGEETAEVIIAAKNQSKDETVYETADLMYHLMVLLVEMGISLEDIYKKVQTCRELNVEHNYFISARTFCGVEGFVSLYIHFHILIILFPGSGSHADAYCKYTDFCVLMGNCGCFNVFPKFFSDYLSRFQVGKRKYNAEFLAAVTEYLIRGSS